MTYGLEVECREVEARVGEEEKVLLRRHVRTRHPNLLGEGPDNTIGFSPLPRHNLSTIPYMWLHAIHDASHQGLFADHEIDHWKDHDEDAQALADAMYELIKADFGEVGITCFTDFSELHDLVDANEYIIEAREDFGLPADPDFALENAAVALLSTRLSLGARHQIVELRHIGH